MTETNILLLEFADNTQMNGCMINSLDLEALEPIGTPCEGAHESSRVFCEVRAHEPMFRARSLYTLMCSRAHPVHVESLEKVIRRVIKKIL